MPLKTLLSRFKKHKAASVNPPGPPNHPSTDGPSQAPGLGSVSGSPPLETQSAPTVPAASIVAISDEHLNPHTSSSPISSPAALGNASTSGILENAHDFVINNPTIVSVSNTFNSGRGQIMQLLESKTIRGAEHDSSARYPPPKCHPETRKTLRRKIVHWVVNPKRDWRMFYVLGPAGVGKSAVAQTVAEEIDCLGASCFISRPNGRNDPDGVIPTLAYQLAVKHARYKHIISYKIAHDPTILTKTRRVQFKELLVDPFRTIMAQDTSALQKPLLIIIDGLDECQDEVAQCEFIELIGDHVRSFPEFPLLWLICSRPESHLKVTLSQVDYQVTCRREEMLVDGKEDRQDVLLYLRGAFRDIQSKHPDSLDDDWPPEADLQSIATAASGLFAFAHTIACFIGDAKGGDPSSKLQIYMKALRSSRSTPGPNPYSALDVLYKYVLSSVPSGSLQTTLRILGTLVMYPHGGPSQSAQALANFSCIGKAAFYYALKPLHSVLRIPSSSDAFTKKIEFYHASFAEFLTIPKRSGEFFLDEAAIHYDVALTALRWHTTLSSNIQKEDIWVRPSEDLQTCLQRIKSQSLDVLWKSCCRIKGKNAINVHQELQNFDFKVLGMVVPAKWQFDDFFEWLDLQEASSPAQKLLNSLDICDECDELDFTVVRFPVEGVLPFISRGLENASKVHLDLGIGRRRRHIHVEMKGGSIMQLLESRTIRGAEHDSSARYPPPKCHPETLKTLRRNIVHWVVNPKRGWRMFYVLGPAGVGKSAVAQSVADEIDCLGASCFISRPNGRNDPDGVIPTLAYQLAVKHAAYKQIISDKIAHDPTILRKTRRAQFKELLVDPFHIMMTYAHPATWKPPLIIIDGLDECENLGAQCEFIELIGDHVRSFPEFPLLWLIFSRPESHLKYALSQADFQVPCRREEISVDDNEGRQDVFLYLRDEFRKIRSKHRDSLDYNWPPETDLIRIATVASGLFAFASTVTRFVDDVEVSDPSNQLRICVKALGGSRTSVGQNPYLSLDLLYQHILSSVHSAIRPTTMRILGMSILYPEIGDPSQTVQALANFSLIGKAAFYRALKPLHSVLRVPSSSDASTERVVIYHASFADFLRDPERSGEFHLDEATIHHDVALTGLHWFTNLEREIQEDDIWALPTEDAQGHLKNIKSQSLSILWKACSRVKGDNAINLYQELHNFDFNILGERIPDNWLFEDFLQWLKNLQEANSSNTDQKLLNSLDAYDSCDQIDITQFDISRHHLANFANGSLGQATKLHLDLGIGKKRRHIHIEFTRECLSS